MPSVSIIGGAGRTDGELALFAKRKDIMDMMTQSCLDWITKDCKLDSSDVTLVSGGSSWADHVAVVLFLSDPQKWKGLTLYYPCKWDTTNRQFDDMTKAGQTLNRNHAKFSAKWGTDSLLQLDQLQSMSKVSLNTDHPGFFNRNMPVSQSDYVIAYTWQSGKDRNVPKEGGTYHTWTHIPKLTVRKHISLYDFAKPCAIQKLS
jgi:hypothetical protein